MSFTYPEITQTTTKNHRFDQAVQKFDEIYEADKKNYGVNHLLLGVILHNLGMANLLVQNFGNAMNCFQKAIVIKKSTLDPSDPQIAVSMILNLVSCKYFVN